MSDNQEKITATDSIQLTAKDLQALQEKGIDIHDIKSLANKVNEQLSDNANEEDNPQTDNRVDVSNVSVKSVAKSPNFAHHSANEDELHDKISQNITELKALKQEQERQHEAFKQYLAEKQTKKLINYKDVRVNIEANAIPTKMFYVMNGLAAVTAGYGMLLNSPAVVIGAMLIAMMLGPISGIALALIDYRLALLKKSLFTLLTGTLLIYVIGLILGFLHPEQSMTSEILARTRPNTMDIAIALAGGVAGAYGMVSPHLSVAVVGVALATTLVPPIVASGILLANGEFMLAMNAMILTITNILAIQVTNALVLWFMGFRRLDNSDEDTPSGQLSSALLFLKRNIITLVLLAVVSVYLTINFSRSLEQQRFEKTVKQIISDNISDKPLYLVSTNFNVGKDERNYLIRAVIQGQTILTKDDVKTMENAIIASDMPTELGKNKPIKLQIRFVPEQVIESTPVSREDVKLDKTEVNQIKNQSD